MEFLWSAAFLTTAGTVLVYFEKKRNKRKIETKRKQTKHEKISYR